MNKLREILEIFSNGTFDRRSGLTREALDIDQAEKEHQSEIKRMVKYREKWAIDILSQDNEVKPPKEIIDKFCRETTSQATAYSYGQIVGGIDTIEKCKKKLLMKSC